MRRRLLDLATIAAASTALLILSVVVASFVWPRTFWIDKLEWLTSQNVETFDAFVRLDSGRVSVASSDPNRFGVMRMLSPRWPGGERRLEQVDYTFGVTPLTRPGNFATASRSFLWPALVVAILLFAGVTFRIARRTADASGKSWRRRSARAIVAVSSCLLVTTILFCIRSFPYFERVDCAVPIIAGPEAIQLNSSRGSIMFAWTHSGPNHTLGDGRFLYLRSTAPLQRGPLWEAAELRPDHYEQAFGFTLGWDGGSALPRNVFIAPYWAVFLVLAGVIALCVRTLRRLRDRDAVERCKRCGYDCRGLADRCPECGTPIVAVG